MMSAGKSFAANFAVRARLSAQWLGKRGPEARLALRVTVAGLVAFASAQAFGLAQGYWAVFTAIVIMQASLGGSFGAAIDYFLGTLAGAAWGVALTLLVPITGLVMLGVALALAIAPMAFLAAIRRNFRVAPITAVIIVIIPALQHTNPLSSAAGRVGEIAIGSLVGVIVSRFVLPVRAYGVVAETAGQILELSARLVPLLFAGFGEKRNLTGIVRLQDGMRRLLIKLDAAVADAARERAHYLAIEADAEPLLGTLRRLRFDFVIIGRAAGAPLPLAVRPLLLPRLESLSACVRELLVVTARSVAARRAPPSIDAAEAAFADYGKAMNEVRRDRLTRDLSDDEVARIFALGFALDQLRRDLGELFSRVQDFARAE